MQINLTPDLSLLAIVAIFIANYFVVKKFLIEPINGVLDSRETDIRGAEKAYEQSLRDFDAATSELETRLQLARREGSEVREGFRREAIEHREELVGRMRAEAGQITGDATTQITAQAATAREQLVRESESLARLAAERILGRSLA